jgi:hypothetical protein
MCILDKKSSTVKEKSFFESIPEKYSAIASGATPIRSAERAPDDIIELRFYDMKESL